MDTQYATNPDAAPKTIGDYGVEVQKAMANNNLSTVSPITAEMHAACPPEPEAKEVAEPPPPVNLGLKGFADALDAAVATNNVANAYKISEDMIAVEAPTPPADPVVAQPYAQP